MDKIVKWVVTETNVKVIIMYLCDINFNLIPSSVAEKNGGKR